MPAEVPCALWVPASITNYRQRPQAQQVKGYSLIVIHITDGGGIAQNTAAMWQEPNHGTSAHFVIGSDGTVIQCVPLAYAAQHAHDCNAYSVGIEHGARSRGSNGPGDPGLPPSDALYQASAQLVAYLCKAAGLPPDRNSIKGHAEADPKTTHDDCPIGAWDWDRYMKLVQAAYDALSPAPNVA